jgi:hypothetical protein
MKAACHLFLLALMLWPGRAHAQPLFRCEHNWTVTAGEHVYGLRQVAQAPGDLRWAQVWVGRCTFDIRCPAAQVVALAALPPADPIPRFWRLMDWGSFRRLP